MIERDRALLARVASVNRSLGLVVVELMQRQDGGELPAQPLREIGQALRALADDMLDRAAEIDPAAALPHARAGEVIASAE